MQGQLRQEHLSVAIQTTCAHCGQPLRIEVDSELKYLSVEAGAEPLVFAPLVNFSRLADPSIIDAF